MKKNVIEILFAVLICGCGPKAEPGISISDWSEQTKSSAHHIARDTYTVVISYFDRGNDTLSDILYSHFPTSGDIVKDFSTNVPSFKAPDNEHGRTYRNVKDVSVIKATVSANNIEYIQSMVAKQDSMKH